MLRKGIIFGALLLAAGCGKFSSNECDAVAKRVCNDAKVRAAMPWKDLGALALDDLFNKFSRSSDYVMATTADEACQKFKNAAELLRAPDFKGSQFEKNMIKGACAESSKVIDQFLYVTGGR
jgi:hypothetical protein